MSDASSNLQNPKWPLSLLQQVILQLLPWSPRALELKENSTDQTSFLASTKAIFIENWLQLSTINIWSKTYQGTAESPPSKKKIHNTTQLRERKQFAAAEHFNSAGHWKKWKCCCMPVIVQNVKMSSASTANGKSAPILRKLEKCTPTRYMYICTIVWRSNTFIS